MRTSEKAALRPELLAPAGDRGSLDSAIANGADAVYLGTREFNARVHAKNFSLEALGPVVQHCHSRGVRVYLTLNTLVKNHELDRFFGVLSRAYATGIDGVIIQHLSFLRIIKESFPGLAVFMSTQAAIGNTASASLLKEADRIILPREMHLDEISRIVDSGVRVEVFVHGALCFSYSGLCLFSSFVGDRSGNRGCCAQLCRQKYNGSYPLSTKELCLARRIPELLAAGITGFKIEGRMRSSLYVAVATRLYRKAIDSCLSGKFVVPEKELSEIEVVFNREFTEGFMFGQTDLVSPQKPMNRGALLGMVEGGRLLLQRSISLGDGVGVWGEKGVSGAVIERITVGTRSVIRAEAGDSANLHIGAGEGSRIYLTSSVSIREEPDFTVQRPAIPVAERKPVQARLPLMPAAVATEQKFLARTYSVSESIDTARAGADVVFYDVFAPDFPKPEEWAEKAMLGAYLPRILTDAELDVAWERLLKMQPRAILSGNLGFLARRSEFTGPVYIDYSLNAFNDVDLAYFEKYRAIPILSPELSLREMKDFKNKSAAVMCHGDIVLVNTRIEIGEKSLVDDKGLVFPVRREGSYSQVLNSRSYGMFNDILVLRSAGYGSFFIDKRGQSGKLVTSYRRLLAGEEVNRRMRKGHTAGHLYRPVE